MASGDANGDLFLGRVVAGTDVVLKAAGNIVDLYDDVRAIVINADLPDEADPGTLTLTAGGAIGESDNPLDISTVPNGIYATAQDSIHLNFIGDAILQNIQSQTGDVDLDLAGTAFVNYIQAEDGRITIDSDDAIVEGTADGAIDLLSLGLVLNGSANVGTSTNPISAETSYLEGSSDGGFYLQNDGALTIGQLYDDIDGIEASGPLMLFASGVMYVREDLVTHGTTQKIEAENNIEIRAGIKSSGGEINILADRNVMFTADGSVNIESGSETILVQAASDGGATGAIEMDSGSTITGVDGLVELLAHEDITLASISADNSVRIESTSGAVLANENNANGFTEITTPDLLILSQGVGGTARPVGTTVQALEVAAGTGGIYLSETDSIYLGGIDNSNLSEATGLDALTATQSIELTAGGHIEVVESISSDDSISIVSTDTSVTTPVSETLHNITTEVFTASDSSLDDEDIVLRESVSVRAGKNITLAAGDDILVSASASLTADDQLTLAIDHADQDVGDGARIDIYGDLNATNTVIQGSQDADTFFYSPESMSGTVTFLGDLAQQAGGDDIFELDALPTVEDPEESTIKLDGLGGSDLYTVNVTGSSDYRVIVSDSGLSNEGADRLTINGTEDDNTFLSRANFVSHIQDSDSTAYERIDYDSSINARLRINGLGGDDTFYSDDNATITTIDGGEGKDTFQFGQLYGAERTSPEYVASGDEIETVLTTLGYLSIGISYPTTVYGGEDNDDFVVYSNKALLKLFGEAGNDEFVIRAFVIDNTDKLSGTDTEINTGDGDDHIEYNINAPVSIDGGLGTDTVVVIGTEVADSFVITEDGIFGAGLTIEIVDVEKIEVDAMEGDDHFFVLSTNAGIVTTLIGGLGSDTIDVAGDVTEDIVSYSVEGNSGVINHAVSSNLQGSPYDGVFVPGLSLFVANEDTGSFLITESDGSTEIDEEAISTSDTYTISPVVKAEDLADDIYVYVTVSAAYSAYKDVADIYNDLPTGTANRGLELSLDGITYAPSLVLTFDSTATTGDYAWETEREIHVRPIDDSQWEGEKNVIISHSAKSEYQDTGETYASLDGVDISNVEVRLIDNDQPEIVLTQTGTETAITEGRYSDQYEIFLSAEPGADEEVTVAIEFDSDEITLSVEDAVTQRFSADGSTAYLDFNAENYRTPVVMEVIAVDDDESEARMRRVLTHSIFSGTDVYVENSSLGQYLFEAELSVTVNDNDSAGVIVTESDGQTIVTESLVDTYEIELTQAPADDETVTLSILTDGQVSVAAGSDDASRLTQNEDGSADLTFDVSNWNTPFELALTALEAGSETDSQPIQSFSAQEHLLDQIRGPLYVEGSKIASKDRTIATQVMLPGETDEERSIVEIDINEEEQTDTLNIFNDGSIEDTLDGTNRSVATETYGGLLALYEADSFDDEDMPAVTEFGNISGLGMTEGGTLVLDFGSNAETDEREFDTGVTYHGFEVVEVLLGSGNDTFLVDGTSANTLTVIHGGGNTPVDSTAGGDTITVTSGGGAESPLVIFGDTAQDGIRYSLTTDEIALSLIHI